MALNMKRKYEVSKKRRKQKRAILKAPLPLFKEISGPGMNGKERWATSCMEGEFVIEITNKLNLH